MEDLMPQLSHPRLLAGILLWPFLQLERFVYFLRGTASFLDETKVSYPWRNLFLISWHSKPLIGFRRRQIWMVTKSWFRQPVPIWEQKKQKAKRCFEPLGASPRLLSIKSFQGHVDSYFCALDEDYSLNNMAEHKPYPIYSEVWRMRVENMDISGNFAQSCGAIGLEVLKSTPKLSTVRTGLFCQCESLDNKWSSVPQWQCCTKTCIRGSMKI